MTGARKVRFDHLIGVYAVGSGDWSWRDEYEKLIDRPVTQQLIESIRSEGIREPVLLGRDGRVWDGHHRIIVAMHLGLDTVPVEFSGVVAEEPEWAVSVARSTGYDDPVIYDFRDRPSAERFIENPPLWFSREDNQAKTLVSRRKAGPWVPVMQES